MNKIFLLFATSLLVLLSACKKDPPIVNISPAVLTPSDRFTQSEILTQQITLNPSGFAPLTAAIQLSTSIATRVQLKVVGKHGSVSDVIKQFDTLSTVHRMAVLGLYAALNNVVEVTLFDALDHNLGSSSVYIQTDALSGELPTITINASSDGKKPGMTLVSYLAYNTNKDMYMPFMFDEFGDIRWYLDYTTSTELKMLNYDDGLERLKNGNLYFGNTITGTIYEVNMLGQILNTWPLMGYVFHHKVLEKPNGNFLVSVTKPDLSTVEDQVIEVDRISKQIINTWDLRQSLQQDRKTLLTSVTNDWMHINAVEYDASDNTIIVSGRTQGVVKLDASNNVKWILGAHKGWGLSGSGIDLNTKLLQPLDGNSQPITDTMVLNGYVNHASFEWNWCQHAVKCMPNGDISLFDNGDNRNFVTSGPYSRAVEYRINSASMTVQQIWTYGRSRGSEMFSRIVSDVDFCQDVDHMIVSPGAVSNNGMLYGKVIEVNYGSLGVVFEATIHPPAGYNDLITFHRTERMSIYP